MASNDFVPFGIGAGANVLTPAQYRSLSARLSGFPSGILPSVNLNTVLRQPSVMAAMLGQFIADVGNVDASDDGDIAGLEAGFQTALRAAAIGAISPTSLVHYGADISNTANAIVLASVVPDVSALSDGMLFEVVPAITNTGTATLKIGTLAARTIVKQNGTAVTANDLRAGAPVLVISLGSTFRIVGKLDSDVLPFTPAGAKQNQVFSPGQQASDLNPPNMDVIIQTLSLTGVSYIDARGSMAFRNDTSSPLNVITYMRLVDMTNGSVVGVGPYLGGITQGGSQVPITIFGIFLGLIPTKQYQVQLMAAKQSAIPCATLDYLIFTLHD